MAQASDWHTSIQSDASQNESNDSLSENSTLVNHSRDASIEHSETYQHIATNLHNLKPAHASKVLSQAMGRVADRPYQESDPPTRSSSSSDPGPSRSRPSTELPNQSLESVKMKDEPVTWRSLPKRGQLAVLTLARLSEPLSDRSLAAYAFYQIRSFDPSLPDSTVTSQGGILTAAFAGAQLLTAVWWGRAADNPRIGRKMVILVGLTGTALAAIGIGFSRTFWQALTCRMLAGALNGNVSVMRTMIGEIVVERKFQSRAFLLLPMCFNIGVVIGPILGGFLADPIHSFPRTFGPGSALGGKDGVGWMKAFPYALPNLFSAFLVLFAIAGVIFGLDETHEALQDRPDWGRRFGTYLASRIRRWRDRGSEAAEYKYERLHIYEQDEDAGVELQIQTPTTLDTYPVVQTSSNLERPAQHLLSVQQGGNELSADGGLLRATGAPKTVSKPTFRSILTPNILLTLLTHHLLAFHVSTFNTLIFLFLPNPRSTHAPSKGHFTLFFSGGLGLSTAQLGLATSIIGVIGLPLQIFMYPRIHTKLGTLRSYRYFLPLSAFAYTLLPFIVLMPASKPWIIWPSLTVVLTLQVLARTFALPSTVILINNAAPSTSSRGTIHGVAQSVSSAARLIGPIIGGWGLGLGLEDNCVGAIWWALTVVVILNEWGIWNIWEGDGQGGRVDD